MDTKYVQEERNYCGLYAVGWADVCLFVRCIFRVNVDL